MFIIEFHPSTGRFTMIVIMKGRTDRRAEL